LENQDQNNHCDNQIWELDLNKLTPEEMKVHTNMAGEITLHKNQDKIVNHEDYKMIKSKINRLYVMIGSSSVALVVFIFSFIKARIQKK